MPGRLSACLTSAERVSACSKPVLLGAVHTSGMHDMLTAPGTLDAQAQRISHSCLRAGAGAGADHCLRLPPAGCFVQPKGALAGSSCTGVDHSRLQAEAQELIIACDCPQYLAKAEKRLAEEAQRVALYLDPSTEAKVVHVAETALIQQQVSPAP